MSDNIISNTNSRNDLPRWLGLIITVIICVSALIVQWGSIKNQLSDISVEIGYLRTDMSSVKERVSFMEGKLNGQQQAQPPHYQSTEGGQ